MEPDQTYMPELPEVQTIVNDLKKEIIGYRIVDITTNTPKVVQPKLSEILKTVKNKIVANIYRRGKMIVVETRSEKLEVRSEKCFLVIHLKLTGRLLLRQPGDPEDQWTRVILKLRSSSSAPPFAKASGGKQKLKELRFADLRKFGYIKLVKNEQELQKLLKDLGPEPEEISSKEFYSLINSRKKAIKQILMDQSIIAGIGNIYANEALFWAGIDPQRSGKSLTEKEAEKLYQAIVKVLNQGIKYRGASAEDETYRDAYGEKGRMQNHLAVYQREGKKCVRCGSIIRRIKMGGRGTFFCGKCQK